LIPPTSAGDLLRDERKRTGSQVGELIDDYIKNGLIVPMEITISLLSAAMSQATTKRFLIDGFPRKLDQAEKFEEDVATASLVLYFECSEEEMMDRLTRRGETSARIDDNIESIRKRFVTFRETSYPVIEGGFSGRRQTRSQTT
jgi:UMP-CMP kinase